MDTHVKVLGAVNVVFGAFGVLLAFALMLIFGATASIAGASGDADAALAVPIIGITGTALVTVLLVLSLPEVIVGIGLVRFRPWARVAGIVLSLVELFMFPFGTILGVYGLWVLFSRDTEHFFNPGPALVP
jgi:hypothetical protein